MIGRKFSVEVQVDGEACLVLAVLNVSAQEKRIDSARAKALAPAIAQRSAPAKPCARCEICFVSFELHVSFNASACEATLLLTTLST